MSIPQDHLLETALTLPQDERAHIAFQLLQSLDPPGKEIAAEEFGVDLRERVKAYRRGEINSSSLEETRAVINQRLSQEQEQ